MTTDYAATDPGDTVASVTVKGCFALPMPPQGPTDARIGDPAPSEKAQINASGSGGVIQLTFTCDLAEAPRLGDELVVTIAQKPRSRTVVLSS